MSFESPNQLRSIYRQQFSFWISRRIEIGPKLEGERGFELKPLKHEVHQVMPAFKHHVTGQGSHILKKRLASRKPLAKQCVFLIAPFQHRVEQEGSQIEAEHHRREILLAVAEVLLEMVALGLEHVVVFVFNLPPSTTGLCPLCHVLRTEPVIRDKGMVREWCARFGMDHDPLDPIDRERVLPRLQPDIIDEALEGPFRQAPLPATLCTLGDCTLGLPKGPACIQLGMRVRLTHQAKVDPLLESPRPKRLLAGESSAHQGHVMRAQWRRMVRHPLLACGLLTVLFVMPILRHEVCGRSSDELCVSRADEDGGNRRMVRQGLTIGKPPRETIWTMEGLGGKVRRAIQGNSPLMVQNAAWVSQVLLLKMGQDLKKDGVKIAWRPRIEAFADVLVARAWLDPEEGLSIIVSLMLVELALVRQK
jgi:hypothetical protein